MLTFKLFRNSKFCNLCFSFFWFNLHNLALYGEMVDHSFYKLYANIFFLTCAPSINKYWRKVKTGLRFYIRADLNFLAFIFGSLEERQIWISSSSSSLSWDPVLPMFAGRTIVWALIQEWTEEIPSMIPALPLSSFFAIFPLFCAGILKIFVKLYWTVSLLLRYFTYSTNALYYRYRSLALKLGQ